MQQSSTAASNNTFGNSSAGSVQSIFNAQFFIFQLNFGSSADFDNSYATGQFSQTFLQFFFIEIRSGFRNLCTDLSNTCSNSIFITQAINDSSQFFGYTNLTCAAKVCHACAVQFTANFFTDNGCTGQSSDILQHCFTTVAEARSFNSNSLEGATQFVNNQGCQCFAFNIFSDD